MNKQRKREDDYAEEFDDPSLDSPSLVEKEVHLQPKPLKKGEIIFTEN